jgi:putative membrane protein
VLNLPATPTTPVSAAASYLAHDAAPVRPHDVASAWQFDPLIVLGLIVAAWWYWRGWHPVGDGRRALGFVGGMLVVVVALLSPIDALAGVLLTGHMVQHVLLVSVAAPLLAWSAPGAAITRGAPAALRTRFARTRRRAGPGLGTVRSLRSPGARWLALVLAVWLWHAPPFYDAAVDHDVVHVAEHASFLGAALLFWSVILGPRRQRTSPGFAVLALFTLGLQNIVLSMLMTFSTFAWYDSYDEQAAGWSLDPLADQQLAGVVMWLPSGLITGGALLAVLVRWLSAIDGQSDADEPASAASTSRSSRLTTLP